VTTGDIALAPPTSWTLRLFARAPVSPFWVGLAIAAAWFAFYVLYTAVLCDGPGQIAELSGRTWPSELVWSLIIGMAPAVTAASMRGSLRDLEDLGPELDASSEELAALRRQIVTVPAKLVTLAGLVTAAGTIMLMLNHGNPWIAGRRPDLTHPALIWFVGRNVINWWLISRAVVIEVSLARAFSQLGTRLPEVDLLDYTSLAPFGRRGLRSVLLWMLYLSLFSLQYIMGRAEPILGLGLVFVIGIALAAFLLPVWGAHLRLRDAKAAELTRLRELMVDARKRTFDAPADERGGGRLADLVAWEQRISNVSEWPFGGTTLLRFVLYTAFGLGSWLGAAFVERLLERALS
jgi:hypothetical protein